MKFERLGVSEYGFYDNIMHVDPIVIGFYT